MHIAIGRWKLDFDEFVRYLLSMHLIQLDIDVFVYFGTLGILACCELGA